MNLYTLIISFSFFLAVVVVNGELGLMTTILEGMRERCFIEELPAKTVILVKHEASLLDVTTRQPITHIPLNLLVTVRDPQGHTVIRQQGKPTNKIFMTSSHDGEYSVCFQAMPTQFVPNLGTRLGLEIFIGDDRDPRITAPIEVQLQDLSAEIAHNNQLISDIKIEQQLQRVQMKLVCLFFVFNNLISFSLSICRIVKLNSEKQVILCYPQLSGTLCFKLWFLLALLLSKFNTLNVSSLIKKLFNSTV